MIKIPDRNFRPFVSLNTLGWRRDVYRSSAWVGLSECEAASLRLLSPDLTYIDLRTAAEIECEPCDWHAYITYRHLPMEWLGTEEWAGRYSAQHLLNAYHSYWSQASLIALEILRWLERSKPGSLVFACSAGKDRTGIIALYLAELLQVPIEKSTFDFVQSFAHSSAPHCLSDNPFTRSFKSWRELSAGDLVSRFLACKHRETDLVSQQAANELAGRLLRSRRLAYWDAEHQTYVPHV